MATPNVNSGDYFLNGQGEPLSFVRGSVSTGGAEYFNPDEPFSYLDLFAAITNVVAPHITGTLAVGQVLACSTGTWSAGSSFTYQWQRDSGSGFVNVSGATSSTYVVQAGDAGSSLRCVVTDTVGAVSASAGSNVVTIPAAPVNTTIPAITPAGPYSSLETVTCDGGSWTNSPTLSYQWYRGASPIVGATSAAYTLQVSDEGANIFCRVTATTGGGSAVADSITIVPDATSPISDASFLNYYSGGAGNLAQGVSIGGARGGVYTGGLDQLFGTIAGSVGQAGGTFYRGIYVRNGHHLSTVLGMVAYIRSQFTHAGMRLGVGVPVEAKNTDLPALPSQTTAPAGVAFTESTLASDGLPYGDLGPGEYRGLWLRLILAPGSVPTPEDDASWRAEGQPG